MRFSKQGFRLTVSQKMNTFISFKTPVKSPKKMTDFPPPLKLWRVYFTVADTSQTFTLVEFIASHADVVMENVLVGTAGQSGIFTPNQNLLREIFTFYTSVDRRSAVDGVFRIGSACGDVIAKKVWAMGFPLVEILDFRSFP